jgi:hypothetical protein
MATIAGLKYTRSARTLRSISAAQVEALNALPAETLEALVTEVKRLTKSDRRADEVGGLAVITAPRFLTGDNIKAAAGMAVAYARRDVADAWDGVDSLDEWAGAIGDLVETYAARPDGDRLNLSRPSTPNGEACAAITTGDLLATMLADAPKVLRDAAHAYLGHDCGRVLPEIDGVPAETIPSTCGICDPTAAGRRPTLAGILQHTRGMTTADADTHLIRRLIVGRDGKSGAAAAARDRLTEALADIEGTRTRNIWPVEQETTATDVVRQTREDIRRQEREAREDAYDRPVRRPEPDTETVTVTRADGTVEAFTHAEIVGAVERSAEDRAEDRRAEFYAARPALGKVAPKSRRGSRVGSTGPTVTVRLGA